MSPRDAMPPADASGAALLTFAWASGGDVQIDASGMLHARQTDGHRHSQPLTPDIDWPTPVVGAMSRGGDSALVGFTLHPLLVHLGPRTGSPHRIALGERLRHAEQLEIFAVTGGFLVRLENGLVFVDDAGRDRWHIDRVTFDWRFVAERDDALWLADEAGNLLGFSIDLGLERS